MITYNKVFKLTMKHCMIESLISFFSLAFVALLPTVEIYVLNYLISQITNGWNHSIIVTIVLYLASSLLLPASFMALYHYCSNCIKCKIDIILASKALKKTLTTSVINIESGDGVNNAYRASQTQYNGIVQVLFDLVELCLAIVQFIVITISLKVVGILTAIIGICLVFFTYKMRYKLSDKSMHFYWSLDEEKRYIDTIYNMILNREYACEMNQYRTQDWLFHEYKTKKVETNKKEYEFEKQMQKSGNKIDYVQAFACMCVILISCTLVYNGVITITWGITCIYAADKLINIVSKIVDKLNQYTIKKLLVNEYNKQIEKKDEYEEEQIKLKDSISIDAKNVKYRYQNASKNVLKGVDFHINDGEKVVLVGTNGSGKSTLIRLLLGFDIALEGDLLYNGVSMKQCMESLRDKTTFMHQKFFKYNLTLRENIVISDCNANQDDLLNNSIQWAELEDIIEKLDSKLDTEIIQGNQLSGGEWQKVALARTKFRDRRFIIMDEPNAAIDASYEVKLYKKLMELGKNKTMLIVSHRLPICQLADKIIVMKEGRVVEVGNHRELITIEDGIYKHLFESQAQLYADGG